MIRAVQRAVADNAHHIVMGAMFAGAVGLGVLLLPGDAERVAMLERDGLEREALQILEERFAAGDRRQHTLYQLGRSYEQTGNIPKARQMLELLAEQRPRDLATQTRLSNFLKQIGDQPAYLAQLNRQIDVKYAEAACKELVGVLRLAGDYAEEQAALQKCRQKGYRRPEDMVRLAGLLAADGDVAQAAVLLRGVDDLKRLKSERERVQLFAMLVDSDQPREALRRGIKWAKGGRDENLALTLIEMLLRAKNPDTAIEFAREVGVPGDRVSLSVAEIMIDKADTASARAHLASWLDRARAADSTLGARFVDACLAADDPATAYRGAKRLGWAKLPQAQLVGIAEGLAADGRRAELDDIRTVLTAESIARSPVLSVALRGSEPPEAPAVQPAAAAPTATAVAAVPGVEGLHVWRTGLWLRLLADNGNPSPEAALRRMGVEKPGSTEARAERVIRQHKKAKRLRFKFKPRHGAAGVAAPKPVTAPSPASAQ